MPAASCKRGWPVRCARRFSFVFHELMCYRTRMYEPGVLQEHCPRDVFSNYVLRRSDDIISFNTGQLTPIPCEYAELGGTSGVNAVSDSKMRRRVPSRDNVLLQRLRFFGVQCFLSGAFL